MITMVAILVITFEILWNEIIFVSLQCKTIERLNHRRLTFMTTVKTINRRTDVENNTLDYVDLGLPSGTKWMKCNIGANKETDHGLYFQWGATVGYSSDDAKAHSYWSTCPGNGGASLDDSTVLDTWDKDNLTDGVLNANVDAAYVHTNGKAKMPTDEQFEELIANTTPEWVIIDGVRGRKFTSESNPNKYVFFPASGCFIGGSKSTLGSFGRYWSSSVCSLCSSYAQNLYFSSSNVCTGGNNRRYAQSVRGVLV